MSTIIQSAMRTQLQKRWERFARHREKHMGRAAVAHVQMTAAAADLDAFDRQQALTVTSCHDPRPPSP